MFSPCRNHVTAGSLGVSQRLLNRGKNVLLAMNKRGPERRRFDDVSIAEINDPTFNLERVEELAAGKIREDDIARIESEPIRRVTVD